MSEARLPRRRRSAARTPILIDPADIPEDAAGRVEVLAVRAPADVIDPVDPPLPPPAPPGPSRVVQLSLLADGWIAAAIVAVIVLVIFLVGLALTR